MNPTLSQIVDIYNARDAKIIVKTCSHLLRINQRLFNVEISFSCNSFIIKDYISNIYIIRKLVEYTI